MMINVFRHELRSDKHIVPDERPSRDYRGISDRHSVPDETISGGRYSRVDVTILPDDGPLSELDIISNDGPRPDLNVGVDHTV